MKHKYLKFNWKRGETVWPITFDFVFFSDRDFDFKRNTMLLKGGLDGYPIRLVFSTFEVFERRSFQTRLDSLTKLMSLRLYMFSRKMYVLLPIVQEVWATWKKEKCIKEIPLSEQTLGRGIVSESNNILLLRGNATNRVWTWNLYYLIFINLKVFFFRIFFVIKFGKLF